MSDPTSTPHTGRRGLLAAGAVAAAALTATPAGEVLAATGRLEASPQGAGFYRFALGDFTATVVSDGDASLPAWPLWSANAGREEFETLQRSFFLPADSVRVHCNALLIDTGRERVLIDAGAGASMGPAFGRLVSNLQRAGIEPASVTTVVISHGHHDHFQGLLDGEGGPTFPNARVVWAEDEWRFWTSSQMEAETLRLPLPDAVKDGIVRSALAVLPKVAARSERLRSDTEVSPGITLVPAPGHTPGQVAVLVSSGGAQLLYAGDALHLTTSSFARPEWSPAFDHMPDVAVATRRRLLDRVAADRILVMAYHFPFPALGHARRPGSGTGYEFVPVAWQW